MGVVFRCMEHILLIGLAGFLLFHVVLVARLGQIIITNSFMWDFWIDTVALLIVIGIGITNLLLEIRGSGRD